jgi:NAD(P)H dehydrogenase (quinone)
MLVSIVVAGAAGRLGRLTAGLLLDRVAPADLVLVTRQPAALADLAARGAVIRPADPAALRVAFAGGERLLLVGTGASAWSGAAQLAAIAAARAASIRHVVYASFANPAPGHPVGPLAGANRAVETALVEDGLAWTLVRQSLCAELWLAVGAQAIAAGRLRTNAGAGRIAYVARADVAAVAAAVLTGEGHAERVYDLTGPELLGPEAVAAELAVVGGRSVAVAQVDDEAYVQGLIAGGLPAPLAWAWAEFGAAVREGYVDRLSPAVAELAGRPPRPLREVLAAHHAAVLREVS